MALGRFVKARCSPEKRGRLPRYTLLTSTRPRAFPLLPGRAPRSGTGRLQPQSRLSSAPVQPSVIEGEQRLQQHVGAVDDVRVVGALLGRVADARDGGHEDHPHGGEQGDALGVVPGPPRACAGRPGQDRRPKPPPDRGCAGRWGRPGWCRSARSRRSRRSRARSGRRPRAPLRRPPRCPPSTDHGSRARGSRARG